MSDLSDIAPDAKSESVGVSDVVASHPATSTPVVSHEPAETSDNDLVERVARTLGIALARDVERDVYASETCIEERRCIAASLLPIIRQEREAAARAALEAARDAVEGYMADCLDDKDVQRHWPRTFKSNLIYGKLVSAIDPKQFAGGGNAMATD